jgi:hypothetical protein
MFADLGWWCGCNVRAKSQNIVQQLHVYGMRPSPVIWTVVAMTATGVACYTITSCAD